MNDAKHTPGPWIIGKAISRRQFRPDDCIEIQTPSGSMVCILYAINASMDGRVDQANARLIAAAPDLLEALTAIRARISGEWANPALLKFGPLSDMTTDIQIIARTAIAKAEGK